MLTITRRLVRPAVFAGIAAVLLASPMAWATHTVTITHQPPPAAKAGEPIVLTAVVSSDCKGFTNGCEDIYVTAYYDVNGTQKSVTTTAGSGGTATLTIPGSDVQQPSFSYYLVASQEECGGIGGCTLDCHTATARSPASGNWGMPVV